LESKEIRVQFVENLKPNLIIYPWTIKWSFEPDLVWGNTTKSRRFLRSSPRPSSLRPVVSTQHLSKKFLSSRSG